MSRPHRPNARAAALMAAALGAACNLEVAPSVDVEVQAEPIARGQFRSPDVFDVQGEGAQVIALVGELDVLNVFNIDAGTRCELSNVAGAVPLARYDPRARGLVLNEQYEPTRIMSFSDIDCAPPSEGIDNVSSFLPLVGAGTARTLDGVSVLTRDGELSWHDPSHGDQRSLASGVLSLRSSGGRLWLIENGALTVRAYNGELVTSIGDGVTQFVVGRAPDQAAWVDATGLHFLDGFTNEPIDLAPDGCEPYLYLEDAIAYYAPCAARRLVLRSLTDGTETEIGSGITAYRQSGDQLYFVSGGTGAIGDLYAATPGQVPELIASGADLNSIRAKNDTENYLLHEWNGSVGSLAVWDHTNGSVTTLLPEVYRYSLVYGPEEPQLLVMLDFADGVGRVELRDGPNLELKMEAEAVSPSWFRASGYITGLAFLLSDFDPELASGTLEVWDTLVNRRWTVKDGVSVFRESMVPAYGMLINAPHAEEPGLWYGEITVQGGFEMPF